MQEIDSYDLDLDSSSPQNELVWKIDEVKYDIDRLSSQINEVQRAQMWSNTRIRQDVVAVGAGQVLALLAIVAVWTHAEWSNWYYLIPTIGLPIFLAYQAQQIAKQDEPR